MKSNKDKCHLLIFGAKKDGVTVNIGAKEVSNPKSGTLLFVILNPTLNFSHLVNKLCMEARQKLHAIARVFNYMHADKFKPNMRSFSMPHFSYCPLIWMCHK